MVGRQFEIAGVVRFALDSFGRTGMDSAAILDESSGGRERRDMRFGDGGFVAL